MSETVAVILFFVDLCSLRMKTFVQQTYAEDVKVDEILRVDVEQTHKEDTHRVIMISRFHDLFAIVLKVQLIAGDPKKKSTRFCTFLQATFHTWMSIFRPDRPDSCLEAQSQSWKLRLKPGNSDSRLQPQSQTWKLRLKPGNSAQVLKPRY